MGFCMTESLRCYFISFTLAEYPLFCAGIFEQSMGAIGTE
jgi:hypothetical protein